MPAVIPQNKPAVISEGSTRVSQIMKWGFPGESFRAVAEKSSEILIIFTGMDNIRSFDDYVLSYDRRTRIAHWVFEHLTADSVKHNNSVDRTKCDFRHDESIHPYFRSENSDYKGSGYDRGHLAAAGNHKQQQRHCDQTFFLSNISPQVGSGFNRDAWNNLERYVRKLTKVYLNVYCCTGPLFLPRKESDGKTYVKYQVIGNNHVAVPTHFYKVVVCETTDGKLELEAFVMPNQKIDNDTPLTAFQVPPESIERAAGLLFFDRVNKNLLTKINGKKV